MPNAFQTRDWSRGIARRRLLAATGVGAGGLLSGCLGGFGGADAPPDDAPPDDAGDDEPSGDAPSDPDSQDDAATDAADSESTAVHASRLSADDVRIDLPDAERLDRPVRPRITGLPADATVRLAYRTTAPDGEPWSGSATFLADGNGVVDLGDAAPLEGSYDDADPMGPFWSMEPGQTRERAWFPHATHDVEFSVEVTALPDESASTGGAGGDGDAGADDGAGATGGADADAGGAADAGTEGDPDTVLASATTTRRLPAVETEPAGEGLVGTIHLPPSADDAPAVLVLHGSGGTEQRHVARLLADAGFVALSLLYFGDADPIPDALAGVPLSYVQRAIDRLRGHERTAGGDVGVYGASKGAELALVAGVHLERVGAIASVAPSAYVWEGLTASWRPAGTSSWSLDGEPLDAVQFPREAPSAAQSIGDTYELALERADESTVEAATIPVEELQAPTLLVSGGDDAMWPSGSYARSIVDRVEQRDADVDVEHLHVPAAGHAIGPPYVPTWGTSEAPGYSLGGTPAANVAAAAEHWPAVLDRFEQSLDDA